MIAQTRSGKQVLNVRGDVRAHVCKPVTGDHVACVGENRKVLVFELSELPEMGRGKGVRLQKYKDGGLSDATTFDLAGRAELARPGGAHKNRNQPDRMARKARRYGSHGTTRLPARQPVYLSTHSDPSASCVSSPVRAGTKVQIIRARLEIRIRCLSWLFIA